MGAARRGQLVRLLLRKSGTSEYSEDVPFPWPRIRFHRPPSRGRQDRLRRLAEGIDALAEADSRILRRAEQIGARRARAAVELYTVCAEFTRSVNALLRHTEITLDPGSYAAEHFREDRMNLFQINARGRILQVQFEATPGLVSTENFRVPYILEGSVRCFNQQLLERDLIEEQLLFYCSDGGPEGMWRFFDGRTYRTGPFDQDYLISLVQQLL